MTAVWITIAALTVGTFGMKIAGPLVLGDRPPGPRTLAMTGSSRPRCSRRSCSTRPSAPTATGSRSTPGRPASAPRSSRSSLRAPMIVVVLVAAAATAAVRAFS